MKQLLQSEFNKGGKIYKNISSPETSGTQVQITDIVLDGGVLKLSTDNGTTFVLAVTQQGNELQNNTIKISNYLYGFSAGGNGATATSGGAVGDGATATSGGAVGTASKETYGGGAIGNGATAGSGGAVGASATADSGGAIGSSATATSGGGAVGQSATAEWGGAIGNATKAGNGFSGGYNAQVGKDSNEKYIDAIQLGTGTNNTPRTLQVYTHKVYDSTKDSLYGYYLNDKTPAVIETVWSGTFSNDGPAAKITVSTYSQYDYFILYGAVEGGFCNIIPNINDTYGFTKKANSSTGGFNVFSFVYEDGSFTWGQSGFYTNGNFTFVDRTGAGIYNLYKIEGVKICKE